jgi:hypothetical protein
MSPRSRQIRLEHASGLRQNPIRLRKDLTRISGIVESPADDIADKVGLPCFADGEGSGLNDSI